MTQSPEPLHQRAPGSPSQPLTPVPHASLDRRAFLRVGASCAAYLSLLAPLPVSARRLWRTTTQSRVVVEEPWGRIEKIADGVWALISTPLQDRKTLCNGAIVAGQNRVVIVEAFGSNEGAQWLAGWAQRLTGRAVDDVIVTHYHADHSAGLAGFTPAGGQAGALLRATATTIDLVRADDIRRNRPTDATRAHTMNASAHIDPESTSTHDLGGRTLTLHPRGGHTASDVSVELDQPSIVIAGDLLWNRMFPNYVDAVPSRLSQSVRALARERETIYVPGHGALADQADFLRYRELIDLVEAAARRAHERGTPAAEAAREFKVPESLGEWIMFSPRYYEVALGAWIKELGA